jgi:hypothetical protein
MMECKRECLGEVEKWSEDFWLGAGSLRWLHLPWDEPLPATSNPHYPTFKPFPVSLSQSIRRAIPHKCISQLHLASSTMPL